MERRARKYVNCAVSEGGCIALFTNFKGVSQFSQNKGENSLLFFAGFGKITAVI